MAVFDIVLLCMVWWLRLVGIKYLLQAMLRQDLNANSLKM